MLPELLIRWRSHQGFTFPPKEPLELWRDERGAIYIGAGCGPPVPYGPARRENGSQNHGYTDIKGDAEAARRIPEAVGWPELQQLLIAINASTSPIESVGCEKKYFPPDIPGGPVQLGSYVNLMFREVVLNDAPENALLLASILFTAVGGCQQWSSGIEIDLERFGFVAGTVQPWGLLLRVVAFGYAQEHARKSWGLTVQRLGDAIAKLPRHLRWV